MEGYNPSAFCTLTSCAQSKRSWVPAPGAVFPRRNALIDAYAITEDPCHPPGRCYPCRKPVPKFRMQRDFGGCDLKKFKCEQKEAQRQDCLQKWNRYYESLLPQPCLEVGVLDSSNPIQFETDPPYTGRWKEIPCKTELTAGYFNPDDNKSPEKKRAERCDPAYVNCEPELPLYPCRGIINFPRLRWVTKEEEDRQCFPADCKKGPCSYLTPEYLHELKRKRERWAREDRQKVIDEMKREQDLHDKYLGCYACPCKSGRCSETIGCYQPTQS